MPKQPVKKKEMDVIKEDPKEKVKPTPKKSTLELQIEKDMKKLSQPEKTKLKTGVRSRPPSMRYAIPPGKRESRNSSKRQSQKSILKKKQPQNDKRNNSLMRKKKEVQIIETPQKKPKVPYIDEKSPKFQSVRSNSLSNNRSSSRKSRKSKEFKKPRRETWRRRSLNPNENPHNRSSSEVSSKKSSKKKKSYYPLMETFTPEKDIRIGNRVIIEEHIMEHPPVKNITVHEFYNFPQVADGFNNLPRIADEFEGVPRVKITIPSRRPFRFSNKT